MSVFKKRHNEIVNKNIEKEMNLEPKGSHLKYLFIHLY